MVEQNSNSVHVAHIKYRTDTGNEGSWAVVAGIADEAAARQYLATSHPNYTFLGVTFETRTAPAVVRK